MHPFPEVYTIIDTETTGMRPPFSRVIDVGIIRVEKGQVVERYQTLLNPGVAVPRFITRITSLTDADLDGAPAFEDVALTVKDLFKGAVFVAHNASFDYSFIKSEFRRIDLPFEAETLCSVQLSRALFPRERSHSLDSIIGRYGITVSERHRALPDAEAVLEFFERLVLEVPHVEIKDAVESVRQTGIPERPPRLARDTFRDVPDSAGVYFFYGPEQELLYVGKSKNLRTRTRSHFHKSENKKEQRIQAETTRIQSVKTSGELSALILESALVKAESPLYNRALRKRKQLVIAKRSMSKDGYATVSLERTGEVSPAADVLGVFRNTTQAKGVLRTIAKDAGVCPKLLGVEQGIGACFASQLGACKGACVGKESAEEHNMRVDDAFKSRRMRTWPYKGAVLIDEKENADTGTVFFIDNWTLRGAFRYEGEEYSEFAEGMATDLFDYDTYKILVRFMLNQKNAQSIKVLSDKEFDAAFGRCTGYDPHDSGDPELVIT